MDYPGMSFEDALNFRPTIKQSKKSGKHGKSTKPGKSKIKITSKSKTKVLKSGKTKTGKKGPKSKGRGRPLSPLSFEGNDQTGGALGGPKPQKKKEDMVFDLEQQFLLRLPPGPAIALRRDVESGVMNLKDKFFLETTHDMRHCKVTYGGQVMSAKLMDLPTIIQCMKTTDMKNFYVTADISQMMVCVSDDEDSKDDEPTKKKDKDNKWKWNHGITPPLKNVRKRRFRKTVGKKEQPDIEKEVRRLFRADAEAIDVKWEVVIEDQTNNDPANTEKQVLAQGTSDGAEDGNISKNSLLDIDEEHIFGEVSSSEDEDDEEKDLNVESDDDTKAGLVESDNSMQPGDYSQMGDSSMMGADTSVDFQAKLEELDRTLQQLKAKRSKLQAEEINCDSYILKEQLQQELAVLQQEINLKENEYKILAAMYQ